MYVVRGKVMFWHASVYLSTPGGGGGTLARSSRGGGTRASSRGGTPPQVPPGRTPTGGYPTSGTPLSSTWYAAVGMPLAFTQEDFLVYHGYGSFNEMLFDNQVIDWYHKFNNYKNIFFACWQLMFAEHIRGDTKNQSAQNGLKHILVLEVWNIIKFLKSEKLCK